MFAHRHLLGIEGLSRADIEAVLDLADSYVALNRAADKRADALKGLTQINMFFEASTRTQASFELAGKRLGANVMNMSVAPSSVKKGETLIDTAMTLNAMHPDLLVVRHPSSGAVNLLASKVNCAVLNAGDGRHEHPTQALLDALTIRRRKGTLTRLTVAICGDIAHSRVARSNILLLGRMENRIRLIAPPTLMPAGAERMGAEVFQDLREGIAGADVVMMLRLQRERMDGALVPSMREYYHRFGLDAEKLAHAKPDAIVMHPGPMNRGVEIDGTARRRHQRLGDPGAGRDGRRGADGGDGPARAQPAGEERAGRGGRMLTLANARLVDPEGDRVVAGGLVLDGGRIAEVFEGSRPGADCGGRFLAPGIIDIGVKVGEPGERHKESFRTAGAAAAAGGVTTMVTRPDTRPAIDSPEQLEFLQRRAVGASPVHVLPMAALTKGREGREMTEIGFLMDAGAVAFTDARAVASSRRVPALPDLCRRARARWSSATRRTRG